LEQTVSINPNPAPEPFPIWVVWREDQPAHGYFATEDIAKRATIDYWEEDEPVCPDYSWRRDGPRWELVVGGEHGGVYASRHLVYGGAPAAVSVVPPATNQTPPVDRAAVLAALVRDFLDPDPCRLDHHGYCQAHSWMCGGSRCPHARAREVLAEIDSEQPAVGSCAAAEAPHAETPDALPFTHLDDDGDQLEIGAVMASTYDGEAPVVYVATEQHQGDQVATVYVRPERVERVIAAMRAARRAAEVLPAVVAQPGKEPS
jgi:hypothetical protein